MNRFGRVYIYQMAASNAKSYKLTIAVRLSLCTLKTNLCTEILHNLKKMERIWDFLAVVVRISGLVGEDARCG